MRISSSNVIRRTTSLILLRIICFLLFHCHRHSVLSCATLSLNSFRLILPLSTYVCLVSISHVLAIEHHHPMDSMHVTLPDSDSIDHLSVSDKPVNKDTYNKLIDNSNNNPNNTPTKFPCDSGAVSSSSSSSSSSDGNGGTSSDGSSGGDDSKVPSPMSSPSHVLRFTKVLSQQQTRMLILSTTTATTTYYLISLHL